MAATGVCIGADERGAHREHTKRAALRSCETLIGGTLEAKCAQEGDGRGPLGQSVGTGATADGREGLGNGISKHVVKLAAYNVVFAF